MTIAVSVVAHSFASQYLTLHLCGLDSYFSFKKTIPNKRAQQLLLLSIQKCHWSLVPRKFCTCLTRAERTKLDPHVLCVWLNVKQVQFIHWGSGCIWDKLQNYCRKYSQKCESVAFRSSNFSGVFLAYNLQINKTVNKYYIGYSSTTVYLF